MQEGTTRGITLCLPLGQTNRQDDSNHASGTHSPSVVPGITTAEEQGPTDYPVVRGNSSVEPGSPPQAGLVVQRKELVKWESNTATGTRHEHRDGRVNARMGSSLQWCADRWSLVTDRGQEPHKLPGAPCSFLCGEVICQGQTRCPHLAEDGQQKCCLLCELDGRDSLPGVEQPGNSAVAMVSGEESGSLSRTPPRNRQPCSRRGVKDNTSGRRMEATSGNILADHTNTGEVRSRPFCNTAKHSIGEVCELEARPRSDRVRCITTELDRPDGVCLSPLLPNRQVPQESERGKSIPDTNSPSVEVSAVVSGTPGAVDRLSSGPTSKSSTLDRPVRQASPSDGGRSTPASRLEAIRSRQLAEGISEETTQLLASRWSKGTNAAYESAWKRWDSWCSQ